MSGPRVGKEVGHAYANIYKRGLNRGSTKLSIPETASLAPVQPKIWHGALIGLGRPAEHARELVLVLAELQTRASFRVACIVALCLRLQIRWVCALYVKALLAGPWRKIGRGQFYRAADLAL